MEENFGIDTVRFHKNFTEDEVRRLITPHLRYLKQTERENMRNGEKRPAARFHEMMNGWHWYNHPNGFSFELSLPKLVSSDGSNLVGATPEMVEQAIRRLESTTGLSLRDADVSRLDFGVTFECALPVSEYLDLAVPRENYELIAHPTSRVIKPASKEHELGIYDKAAEMEGHGHPVALQIAGKNWMKAEYRGLRHLNGKILLPNGYGRLTLGALAGNTAFFALCDAFMQWFTWFLRLEDEQKEERRHGQAAQALYANLNCKTGYACTFSKLDHLSSMAQSATEADFKRIGEIKDVLLEDLEKAKKRELYSAARRICAAMKEKYPPIITAAPDVQALRRRVAKKATKRSGSAAARGLSHAVIGSPIDNRIATDGSTR